MAAAFLMLVGASGCASTDFEYSCKLATARTDWKGGEIVGIWVTKFNVNLESHRITLLLRPDGTGQSITKMPGGRHWESNVQWHFSGNGVWAGSGEAVGTLAKLAHGTLNSTFTLRYNGSELLLNEGGGIGAMSMVFVPSDNEAAIEEHLKKR